MTQSTTENISISHKLRERTRPEEVTYLYDMNLSHVEEAGETALPAKAPSNNKIPIEKDDHEIGDSVKIKENGVDALLSHPWTPPMEQTDQEKNSSPSPSLPPHIQASRPRYASPLACTAYEDSLVKDAAVAAVVATRTYSSPASRPSTPLPSREPTSQSPTPETLCMCNNTTDLDAVSKPAAIPKSTKLLDPFDPYTAEPLTYCGRLSNPRDADDWAIAVIQQRWYQSIGSHLRVDAGEFLGTAQEGLASPQVCGRFVPDRKLLHRWAHNILYEVGWHVSYEDDSWPFPTVVVPEIIESLPLSSVDRQYYYGEAWLLFLEVSRDSVPTASDELLRKPILVGTYHSRVFVAFERLSFEVGMSVTSYMHETYSAPQLHDGVEQDRIDDMRVEESEAPSVPAAAAIETTAQPSTFDWADEDETDLPDPSELVWRVPNLSALVRGTHSKSSSQSDEGFEGGDVSDTTIESASPMVPIDPESPISPSPSDGGSEGSEDSDTATESAPLVGSFDLETFLLSSHGDDDCEGSEHSDDMTGSASAVASFDPESFHLAVSLPLNEVLNTGESYSQGDEGSDRSELGDTTTDSATPVVILDPETLIPLRPGDDDSEGSEHSDDMTESASPVFSLGPETPSLAGASPLSELSNASESYDQCDDGSEGSELSDTKTDPATPVVSLDPATLIYPSPDDAGSEESEVSDTTAESTSPFVSLKPSILVPPSPDDDETEESEESDKTTAPESPVTSLDPPNPIPASSAPLDQVSNTNEQTSGGLIDLLREKWKKSGNPFRKKTPARIGIGGKTLGEVKKIVFTSRMGNGLLGPLAAMLPAGR